MFDDRFGPLDSEPSISARYAFSGRLPQPAFADFLVDRASRLGLDLAFDAITPSVVIVTVSGPTEWLDAFELACSLGPADSRVASIEVTASAAPKVRA